MDMRRGRQAETVTARSVASAAGCAILRPGRRSGFLKWFISSDLIVSTSRCERQDDQRRAKPGAGGQREEQPNCEKLKSAFGMLARAWLRTRTPARRPIHSAAASKHNARTQPFRRIDDRIKLLTKEPRCVAGLPQMDVISTGFCIASTVQSRKCAFFDVNVFSISSN
jgi:hypothetical protein